MNINIFLPFKLNLSRGDFLFKVFDCGATASLQVVGVIERAGSVPVNVL